MCFVIPRHPHPDAQAHGGNDRGGPHLRHFPAPFPVGLRGHLHPAGGDSDVVSRHVSLGINANIMSLGGIAIAIGVMVDASVVMVENAHKHLERDQGHTQPHRDHPGGRQRGGAGPVLQPADHHRLVSAGVQPAGAVRAGCSSPWPTPRPLPWPPRRSWPSPSCRC